MGTVYLAEHPEIGKKVAVKVLREELATDEGLLSRFLNEARAANAIRHPNIIEVLDGGRTPGGKPYMVMELLEGQPLSARVARLGRLPLRETLEFSYQAASALAAAHAKGIIHRDLKPDNLYVVADPLEPTRLVIKVLDFGIAKLQTQPRDAFRTRTGTLMGTPTYMSPEQCLGTKEVDLRSDVYALGVIMFEMLTGRPPFMSEGFGELVNMHINAAPPDMRQVVPDLPAAVEAIVRRCLAKNPDDRFASMADLQAALRTAAGTLRLGGRSSPNLEAPDTGRTLALPETQAVAGQPGGGRSLPSSGSSMGLHGTTMAGASGEAAGPRRGVMIGGVAALVAGALALFLFLRSPGPHGSPPNIQGPSQGPSRTALEGARPANPATEARPAPSRPSPADLPSKLGEPAAGVPKAPASAQDERGTKGEAGAEAHQKGDGDRGAEKSDKADKTPKKTGAVSPRDKDGSHRPHRAKPVTDEEPAKL
jgi:serine/threonine-protein kinase